MTLIPLQHKEPSRARSVARKHTGRFCNAISYIRGLKMFQLGIRGSRLGASIPGYAKIRLAYDIEHIEIIQKFNENLTVGFDEANSSGLGEAKI